MVASMFDYDQAAALDIREVGIRQTDGIVSRLLTFASPYGHRRVAELVSPPGEGPFPAILYVHWYEPEAPDSSRIQFLDEARLMAKRGAAALLVETMWSDRDWFIKRTQADDYESSVRQVVELRRALDLLSQLAIDPDRLAYAGHDFGAMYGVLMGSVDRRPSCYVLMAGTPRFSDWYLYYPKLEGEEREAYIQHMAPIDPIAHVAQLSPAPLLFQFGRSDYHVPEERALAFSAAASDPKDVRWYDAGHGLSPDAAQDRIAWLCRQLQLPES